MQEHKKNILFYLLLFLLAIPAAQQQLHIIRNGRLHGSYVAAASPVFSLAEWGKGDFQQQTDKYITENVGFRPYLIRASNQIDYTFFNKVHCDLIVAKDHYLFQQVYIDDYEGKLPKDVSLAHTRLFKLKAIQDTLQKLGKTFVLVYAPSKIDFYSEYLPDGTSKGIPCGEFYKHIADSLGINQIDCNSWFLAMKHSTPYPLFSHQGIHWTTYGSLLAADSIIKYLEVAQHIAIPRPHWDTVEYTYRSRGSDADAGHLLNIILPVTYEKFCYPKVHYSCTGNCVKPRTVYIGDSFVWPLIYNGMMKYANTDWQFWYYFSSGRNQYTQDNNLVGYTLDNVWQNKIDSANCVIMIYTSHNLPELGNGFIEKEYDHYFSKTSTVNKV